MCPHPLSTPDLAPSALDLPNKVKMAKKGKLSEPIQGIKADITVQLKTHMEEHFQNCFRKQQNDEINVFKARWYTLREIIGNISFLVIFLKFKHLLYFLSHLNYRCT